MLVLTRPDLAARRFARAARRAGWPGAVLFSPVLEMAALPGGPLPAGTPVFTSENGVRAATARQPLSGREAWAVGAGTARAARAAGMRVRVAGGDAAALHRALLAEGRGPYLHCRGLHVTGDLAGSLRAAGVEAAEVVLYDQAPRVLTAAARAALMAGGRCVLPLFSARSARLTAAGLPGPPPFTTIVAISSAVAGAWPWEGDIAVAERPDAKGMLAVFGGLVGGGCGG